MPVTGRDIAACARTWLGTRFHHQGRLKKNGVHRGGVDCLGLLAGVAHELQLRGKDGRLLTETDIPNYSHTPDTAKLCASLAALLEEVPIDCMREGDVALCSIHDSPQHLAIITEYGEGFGMIHAYAQARQVVEHALDEHWRGKIVAVFRVGQM